ncbi:hypothetical protein [Pseudaquabacterium pictum]|nr:hypothetical protein [Rubrivivax pictus]
MADLLRTAAPRGLAPLCLTLCRWLLAACVLGLAGCGGGGDSSEPAATTTAPTPPAPPASAAALAWDGAQATWDNVVWQ